MESKHPKSLSDSLLLIMAEMFIAYALMSVFSWAFKGVPNEILGTFLLFLAIRSK